MTTLSSATPISMAATANLRALGAELNGWLSGLGLVQQADTGQINWATVNLPAANTLIGYEIWAFPDLSIYFKIQWTTGGIATQSPVMAITVGTGSNGSGTITGQTNTVNTVTSTTSSAISSTSINYTTYACLTSDMFWITWKATSIGGNPVMSFSIEKTVNSAGVDSNLGFVVTTFGVNTVQIPNKQAVRTSSPATTFASSVSFCAVPGNLTSSSNAAGNKQIFLHQYPIPDILLSNGMATIVASEATIATTFTSTLVGTTSQTMISMGNQFGDGNSASPSTSTWSIALRWQ